MTYKRLLIWWATCSQKIDPFQACFIYCQNIGDLPLDRLDDDRSTSEFTRQGTNAVRTLWPLWNLFALACSTSHARSRRSACEGERARHGSTSGTKKTGLEARKPHKKNWRNPRTCGADAASAPLVSYIKAKNKNKNIK